MALCFLLDENVPGPLWRAIQHHNARGIEPLDAIWVGIPPAPPFGTLDPDLVSWSEANGRVLVSLDRQTLTGAFLARIQAGGHAPGLMILRPVWRIPDAIDSLVLHDQACDPADLVDQIVYIP